MKTSTPQTFNNIRGDEFQEKSKLIPRIILLSYFTIGYLTLPKILSVVSPYITSHQTLSMFFISPIGLSVTILTNIFFYVCYHINHPSIEQYKVTDVTWPWVDNPQRWKNHLPKLLFIYLTNYLIFGSIFISLTIRFAKPRYDLESFPSVLEFAFQILFSIFCEDFFFYWSHRLLHTPWLYKRIHKRHHEYYNTIAMACIYTHPIELIIGNIFPMLSALCIFRSNMHAITLGTWIPMRIMFTHDGHSGYDFPFSPSKALPFASTSVYHNYHHLKNIGNYGSSLRIWDHIFGTNIVYLEQQEKARLQRKKLE